MTWNRIVSLLLLLVLAGCGGGGSSGGGSNGGSGIRAAGWLGGGTEGWQNGDAPGDGSDDLSLAEPTDVFVDAAGCVFIADAANHRVVKRDADGVLIGWLGGGTDGWKTGGPSAPPVLDHRTVEPSDVAIADDGTIYVVNRRHAITRWSADGTGTGYIGGGTDGWKSGELPTRFGHDMRSFAGASAVALDADGNLYVAELGNHRVSKWSRDGTALGWIGDGRSGWQTGDGPAEAGYGIQQFYTPRDVVVDAAGNIHVADYVGRVSKWDRNGNGLGWIGGGADGWQTDARKPGGASPQDYIGHPTAVRVAADGTIFVAEQGNHRVSKWSRDGVSLGWIGHDRTGWQTGSSPETEGDGPAAFDSPGGLGLSASGEIVVTDSGNDRVSRWSADGVPRGWIGGGQDGWRTDDAPPDWGEDRRSFHSPAGLDVDPAGAIVVADSQSRRVVRWSRDGVATGWIGGGVDGWRIGDAPTPRADARSFDEPMAVFVTPEGTIYVADSDNDRVSCWAADGTAMGWLGGGVDGWQTGNAPPRGSDTRSFNLPRALWVDARGIFVVDSGNHRICRWTASGVAMGWIGGRGTGWRTGDGADPGLRADEFFDPTGVAVDSAGIIYVADGAVDRICRWSATGQPLGWLGGGVEAWRTEKAPHDDEAEPPETLEGRDARSFSGPSGLWVDGRGRLYVSEDTNRRVSRWYVTGETPRALGWIGHGRVGWQGGSAGDTDGAAFDEFGPLRGLFVDGDGTVFVADVSNGRVSRWR